MTTWSLTAAANLPGLVGNVSALLQQMALFQWKCTVRPSMWTIQPSPTDDFSTFHCKITRFLWHAPAHSMYFRLENQVDPLGCRSTNLWPPGLVQKAFMAKAPTTPWPRRHRQAQRAFYDGHLGHELQPPPEPSPGGWMGLGGGISELHHVKKHVSFKGADALALCPPGKHFWPRNMCVLHIRNSEEATGTVAILEFYYMIIMPKYYNISQCLMHYKITLSVRIFNSGYYWISFFVQWIKDSVS